MSDDEVVAAAIAEFRERCAAIDAHVGECEEVILHEAFAAILKGDLETRDKLCEQARCLPHVAHAAKVEIYLRIGECLGLDRDKLEAFLEGRDRH